MFGVLYWLISGTAMLSNSIGNELYKKKQKQEVYGKEFRLYYDRKGRKFWDGEQVFDSYTHDKKHHWVLTKKDGTVVWDYTQHEEDKKNKTKEDFNIICKNDSIKNGKLYYTKWIKGRCHKVELSTERMYECCSYSTGKYKYFKKYYYLMDDLYKKYEEKIEITKDEYDRL